MILDINTWWAGLTTIEQIYWVVTIPATLFFIIQIILTFVGGDVDNDLDGDVDHDIDHDHGIDFQFLTFKNMIAFFALFGWSGLASIDAGFSLALILILSTIAGLIMMVIMASIFYFMSKLSDSGTLNMQNAVGTTGKVYLSIPGKKAGTGKVQVKVQGTLRDLTAITEDPESIKTGSLIEVIDIVNESILLVKRAR